ncbi:DUF2867 domain-containing protein [Microbacterium sp. HD4P20]|uniref:DUF2867 domain-containing protein n=1 Tax=Microbacterium sp. HD4P20 TaxID=2864874 RepID=UPI001C63BFD8|nr:DUF2867 domain-containing protein [Microbacterium sp. HD4P20]MCP2635476.1 DUF2867 domain-containing protein [Microbacterium sp. HD4P20]
MPHPARAFSAPASRTPLLRASAIRGDWTSRQRQPVTADACADPAVWTAALFHEPSATMTAVLAVRDRLVALVALRPASRDSFRVLARNEDEVLVGSDDRHLDFRASVRCTRHTVDVVTFVEVHNLLGRLYLMPVRIVHSTIVRGMLRRAAKRLDPARRGVPARTRGSS